jgi:hypothetical protein
MHSAASAAATSHYRADDRLSRDMTAVIRTVAGFPAGGTGEKQ